MAPEVAMQRGFRRWILAAGFVLAFLGCGGARGPSPAGPPAPGETMATVQLDQSETWPRKSDFQRGLLHGTASFPPQILDGLLPTSWRLGDLSAIRDLGGRPIVVTEVMSDLYFKKIGSTTFQPWTNWDQFESSYRDLIRDSDSLGVHVDYWEIANEVDGLIPAGTDDASRAEASNRFKELNRRAIRAIRSVKPGAKIIGCSFSGFNEALAAAYLDFLQAEQLKIDAFAWHMIGIDPKAIQSQIAAFRNLLSQRRMMLEIHINEFMGGQNHLVPGWNLAYLTRLFESGITSYSRACWQRPGVPLRTSECVTGLDGLLTPDNREFTKLGALYFATAAMSGNRLKAVPLGDGWSGLVSYDPIARTGSLIIGTYSCGQKGLWCTFSDEQVSDDPVPFPGVTLPVLAAAYASKQVAISRVVLENRDLDAPYGSVMETTEYATADKDGRFPVRLDLKDGEVVVIRFSLRAPSTAIHPSERSHKRAM